MTESKRDIARVWADPDDAPEWTDEMFDRAEFTVGGALVRAATGVLTDTGTEQKHVRSMPKAIRRVYAMAGSKRDLVDTGTDKRYVKRTAGGKFKEFDDQGKSLSQDEKQHAKTEVKSGYGDQGDQKRKK